MSKYSVKFPRMTMDNTGLGPNPIVGGKGGMQGGSGGAPIAFTASSGADELVNGQSVTLDTGTLQSGFRTPYFIDEIRMQVITEPTTVNGAAAVWNGIGGCIRAKFQTGNRAFSKNAVPIGLYGPIFSQQDFGSQAAGIDVDDQAAIRGYSYVRWPLPKPLWMAPGDVIQAMFEYVGLSPAEGFPAVTVNATYTGRAIAPGTPAPRTRQIPWATFMAFQNNEGQKQSTEEFRNPFTYPMVVQRLTSRTYFAQATGIQEELARGQTKGVLNASNQYVVCSLDDSLGYSIVKRLAPIGMVYDTSRHAWTFSRSLGAREQFNLTMRTDDVNGVAPVPVAGWHSFTGMIGYRDEARE
mgnify:CR=1 FL=1